jgi:hypothetical protein
VTKSIILAPVPCRHLASALKITSRRIAFGTDLTDFFPKNGEGKDWKGCRVLIYASRKSSGAAHLPVSHGIPLSADTHQSGNFADQTSTGRNELLGIDLSGQVLAVLASKEESDALRVGAARVWETRQHSAAIKSSLLNDCIDGLVCHWAKGDEQGVRQNCQLGSKPFHQLFAEQSRWAGALTPRCSWLRRRTPDIDNCAAVVA